MPFRTHLLIEFFLTGILVVYCSFSICAEEHFDVAISEVTIFFGPDFYELSEPIINGLKLSPDRTKIAFTVWDKGREIYDNPGIAYLDGSGKKLLIKEEIKNLTWLDDSEIICQLKGDEKFRIFNLGGEGRDSDIKADFTEDLEIPEIAKTRLDDFLKTKYKSHYGVLGGTAEYSVKNHIPSPDKDKIAFLVEGSDGHNEFYPAWYVCTYEGEGITLIDSTARYMGDNAVWLSDNEIAYIKDSRLWKAVIG